MTTGHGPGHLLLLHEGGKRVGGVEREGPGGLSRIEGHAHRHAGVVGGGCPECVEPKPFEFDANVLPTSFRMDPDLATGFSHSASAAQGGAAGTWKPSCGFTWRWKQPGWIRRRFLRPHWASTKTPATHTWRPRPWAETLIQSDLQRPKLRFAQQHCVERT